MNSETPSAAVRGISGGSAGCFTTEPRFEGRPCATVSVAAGERSLAVEIGAEAAIVLGRALVAGGEALLDREITWQAERRAP